MRDPEISTLELAQVDQWSFDFSNGSNMWDSWNNYREKKKVEQKQTDAEKAEYFRKKVEKRRTDQLATQARMAADLKADRLSREEARAAQIIAEEKRVMES